MATASTPAKASKDTELTACIATCMHIEMHTVSRAGVVPVDAEWTKADNGNRSTARELAGRSGITRAMPE